MKLFIDTSNRDKIIIKLGEKLWEFAGQRQKPHDLLGLIKQTCQKEKISLKNISSIEVNRGPGSFTGLRIGLAVANALGYALDIPVNKRRQLVLPIYES